MNSLREVRLFLFFKSMEKHWYMVRTESASKRQSYLKINSRHDIFSNLPSALRFMERITRKDPDVRCRLFREVDPEIERTLY